MNTETNLRNPLSSENSADGTSFSLDSDVFFNEVPTLLALVSRDLTYLAVNRAYANYFRLEQSEIVSASVAEVLGSAFEEALPHLERALAGEPTRYQLHAPCKEGQLHWLDVRYIPKASDTGDIDGVYVVVSDVQDLFESREKIESQNQQLQRLNADLLEFSYSASHDLKAPLTTMSGLLKFCVEDLQQGETEEVVENLERAIELAGRLAGRIDGLLSLARMDQQSDSFEPVSVRESVESIWLNLNADSSARLKLDLDQEKPLVTDLSRFEAIVENLLSNAIKFRKPQQRSAIVELGTSIDDGRFVLEVRDQGIGIPPEYLDSLFRMFQQIRNHSLAGSGVGLALVKRHVTRLGGEISVTSDESGTCVTVALPLVSTAGAQVSDS